MIAAVVKVEQCLKVQAMTLIVDLYATRAWVSDNYATVGGMVVITTMRWKTINIVSMQLLVM